jgi:DNA-binding CsgD family transcriptional regulator
VRAAAEPGRPPADALARGRASYRRGAWRDAFAELVAADRDQPLCPADLESLAVAAYLVCRDDDARRALERAEFRYVEVGDPGGAARCGFWIGLGLLAAGASAQASGWFARARRHLDRAGVECVEQGYLMTPGLLMDAEDDLDAAFHQAVVLAEIGERFRDTDLIAFALHAQGRVRIRQGRVAQGMALLDEAMVGVLAGELSSPLFTGLIYCLAIGVCEEVFEVRRAREWTDALVKWCGSQPQMLNFTGICLVHRAGCLQLSGAWPAALDEARRACRRFAPGEPGVGAARYRQGEIHRLRGEVAAAEDAFRQACERGWQPQPGLALLWLAQGRADTAAAAIRRALGETTDRLARARLLPAYVEIMLAFGAIQDARAGGQELHDIAVLHGQVVLAATAAQAQGAVALTDGDARAALVALREACQHWQELGAPYELAQVRALIGLACRDLGDVDSAGWELAAARDGFHRLGAAPDVARLDAQIAAEPRHKPGGLTPREQQVLRLVAAGWSNRAIAEQLVLSERTVDRHVSNILAKLDVPSRTAAAACAHARHLV